jgi:hypothetical protein
VLKNQNRIIQQARQSDEQANRTWHREPLRPRRARWVAPPAATNLQDEQIWR